MVVTVKLLLFHEAVDVHWETVSPQALSLGELWMCEKHY